MANALVIMKFGGTSVQDAPAIRRLVEIIESRKGFRRLVVVSALAKVTDSLVALSKECEQGHRPQALARVEELKSRHLSVAKELGLNGEELTRISDLFLDLETFVSALSALREVSPRSKDRLMSTGELGSSILVAGALQQSGPVALIDSRSYIVTDSQYGAAQVDFSATKKQLSALAWAEDDDVKITQGFIGRDQNGVTTTLGRGGSDYSAAVYGTCLSAAKVEIWTDVDGILTTDPRMVPDATILPKMHFSEAAELAYFGAKVLHPATIYPALEKRIPVWILNSKNPSAQGTEITFSDERSLAGISGIAFKRNVTLVNIYSTRMLGAHGFLKSVFDIFARCQLSVDLISTSEVNVSLTLDGNFAPEMLAKAKEELEQVAQVEIHTGRSVVAVVGRGIRTTPGLAGQIFSEIADTNVQMISMGASELNISFVIEDGALQTVVQRLHKKLRPGTINQDKLF